MQILQEIPKPGALGNLLPQIIFMKTERERRSSRCKKIVGYIFVLRILKDDNKLYFSFSIQKVFSMQKMFACCCVASFLEKLLVNYKSFIFKTIASATC